jgi:putative transposase
MPRKPRIQFEGALYHVFNRGNYRQDIFDSARTAQAFESCLFEACELFGWLLHAFALMRNHYHAAIETPKANLSDGMHWLQSTFATRFNRLRNERGHLFQGRYGSILVEPGEPLLRVVNYLHLNPVKAGIVTVDQLEHFRWSSLRRFVRGERPKFLVCSDWLAQLDGLQDTPAGWRSYQDYLAALAADEGEQNRQAFAKMGRGWAMGSEKWRKEIAQEHLEQFGHVPLPGQGFGELKEARWNNALDLFLAQAQKTRADAKADWYGADWKVIIAEQLRRTTSATNAWIARELGMGSASTVSVYRSRYKIKK